MPKRGIYALLHRLDTSTSQPLTATAQPQLESFELLGWWPTAYDARNAVYRAVWPFPSIPEGMPPLRKWLTQGVGVRVVSNPAETFAPTARRDMDHKILETSRHEEGTRDPSPSSTAEAMRIVGKVLRRDSASLLRLTAEDEWPTFADLYSAVAIGRDMHISTFRRMLQSAVGNHGKRGRAAAAHRYTPEQVRKCMAALRQRGYLESANLLTGFAIMPHNAANTDSALP